MTDRDRRWRDLHRASTRQPALKTAKETGRMMASYMLARLNRDTPVVSIRWNRLAVVGTALLLALIYVWRR